MKNLVTIVELVNSLDGKVFIVYTQKEYKNVRTFMQAAKRAIISRATNDKFYFYTKRNPFKMDINELGQYLDQRKEIIVKF